MRMAAIYARVSSAAPLHGGRKIASSLVPLAAFSAVFHCASLISSGAASIPCAAGTIFTARIRPAVSCTSRLLLPLLPTSGPRIASMAITFRPGLSAWVTSTAITRLPMLTSMFIWKWATRFPFRYTVPAPGPPR